MKQKSFMAFTICMAIVIGTVFSTGVAWSDSKINPDGKVTVQKNNSPSATGIMQQVKKSNPYITNIFGNECPCKDSVEPAGGILMKGVIVKLVNAKCPGSMGTFPVSGKVKFSWHDVKDKRVKSVTKSFTGLRGSLNVIMIPSSQTILASKRENITAEIVEINGVKDCNPGNNKIIIATCVTESVY